MTTIERKPTTKNEQQVTYLTDVAATIRDDALDQARQKLPVVQRELDLGVLFSRASFIEYFKYGMACAVAKVLVATESHIEAVYVYDPSANPDSDLGLGLSADPTVHLLVHVDTLTAALESFLMSLDRVLTESLKELPTPIFEQRSYILDTCMVSEEDVRQNRGYAALLGSMFAPPLKVWDRHS